MGTEGKGGDLIPGIQIGSATVINILLAWGISYLNALSGTKLKNITLIVTT